MLEIGQDSRQLGRTNRLVGNVQRLRAQGGPKAVQSTRASRAAPVEQSLLPSRWAIQRNQMKFDMVCMSVQRQLWAADTRRGQAMIFANASPQGCLECFNTAVFRLFDVRPVDGAVQWSCSGSDNLLCPIAILAVDHQGDVDKLASLIHQLWLLFGPGVASLQRFCQQVRAIVTDMGT